jgi:hypothetical protein
MPAALAEIIQHPGRLEGAAISGKLKLTIKKLSSLLNGPADLRHPPAAHTRDA